MTLAMNANVAVELTVELLHEAMLALGEREVALRAEVNDPAKHEMVRAIARRQHGRICGVMAGIEDALEGAEIKAAQAAADFLKATAR